MDKAKAAISDFMSRSGHHDTTVHEVVAPAVQKETIKPHQHEEINTAVDKEIHQDHYHRTIQPVKDRDVLPETHTAKLGAVQHREFDHRDAEGTKRALVNEQAQFKNERRVEDTTHSQSQAPSVGGEHVHHHIHETIQPVVQKEVIQPNVVHTTVPIHEVHHNKATHHSTTALPTMTMDEFKHKGGVLAGREERYDAFEGEPKNIGAGYTGLGGLSNSHHKHDSHHADPALKDVARHGDFDKTPAHRDANHTVAAGTTGGAVGSTGTTGRVGTDGPIGKTTSHSSSSSAGTTEHKKPGLLQKLNPKVDADGDGKRGFMD